MSDAYNEDLAWVHASGFTDLAAGAAALLVERLADTLLAGGRVVDLGCGSGTLARLLCEAGYEVLGIDLSEAFLEMARANAPAAEFRQGSFVGFDVPPCAGVAAIGEVLSYEFDPRNGPSSREALFERTFRSLRPGGLLLFDVAGVDRIPRSPHHVFLERDDWRVFVEATREGTTLTRRITTFRREGAGGYRRSHEVHRLALLDPAETAATLEQIGFHVEALSAYGAVPLPGGVHGFLARKPHEPPAAMR